MLYLPAYFSFETYGSIIPLVATQLAIGTYSLSINDNNISFATSDVGMSSISTEYDAKYLTIANNLIKNSFGKFKSF